MSEMIERMCRAVVKAHKPGLTFDSDLKADDKKSVRMEMRAVLAAMREPTEAMRDAGFIFAEGDSAPEASHNIAEAWRRMIDAALTPPTNS